MRTLLLASLGCLFLAVTFAFPASDKEKGIILNLKNGEICAVSMQCKSSCCQRNTGTSIPRCAPLSAENQKCSKLSVYATYYHCKCERGLKCKGDWSVGGTVTNTNFGICEDRNGKTNATS
ncbi:colipase [Esox lucius]|uniref:Colipase n=1 Tax=Esox lucius TaxID=8010 RepID=A0AAY5KBN3_ESOLU|nr:colipase [Esox lucius]